MSIRVLLVHNAYQHKGGEDTVVEAEVALLRSKGHEVELFVRHNDAIVNMPRVAVVAQTVWSRPVSHDFDRVVNDFKPDVVHVHNTFPLISPAIYWAAKRHQIPVVQTLHNFRLMCPQAMFLRNNQVCEDCLGTLPWRGALRGCYRNSKVQSSVLAGMLTIHRALGTWRNKVTRYIALNDFCRRKFIEGGLPAKRLVVKPNFVDFPAPPTCQRQGFLFVGRLSVEKGIQVLVDAALKLPDLDLKVAGTGPEEHLLARAPQLKPLGALSGDQVREQMSQSQALVIPSIWYENFPRTIVEAFGCGLLVIASRIGALADIVQDGVTGLLFNPGDADDLAAKMQWARDNPEQMAIMGLNARALYESQFTAEINYQQLIAIYTDAINEVKTGI